MSSTRGWAGSDAGTVSADGSDPFALGELTVGGPANGHRRYYEIAGVTLQVESDLPLPAGAFAGKFATFAVDGPGPDTVVLRHHFELPAVAPGTHGRRVRHRAPWAIFEAPWGWLYRGVSPDGSDGDQGRLIATDASHSRTRFFNLPAMREVFARGGAHALTLMPTDQILLARVLAERQACFLHSCGIVLDGRGVLFVGESGAGKSTAMRLFSPVAESLCDDRNIVRRWPDGFRVHGTWSHGTVPIVSAGSAPLRALFFLDKADRNTVTPMTDRAAAAQELLPRVVRPLVTADWWERTFDLLTALVREVPCYRLGFDRSGGIVDVVRRHLDAAAGSALPAAGA